MNAPARLSVIIPVYNDANGVHGCIDGLRSQTDPDYEVVLVNDGSTDDTAAVLGASGYRVVTLARNKGQAVARNAGAAAATGDILIFLDADTVPPPEWLARHRALLVEHPDAAMVCSGYSHCLSTTPAAQFAFEEQAWRRRGLERWIDSATGSNCAVRRADFDAVGGYPEYYLDPNDTRGKACAVAEDSELGWLFARSGRKILWTPDNPVAHRFRESWTGYLRQQADYSRFLTISVFQFPSKVTQRGIYAGEPMLPQVAVAAAMLGAPLLAPVGGLVYYLLHRRFLRHLAGRPNAPGPATCLTMIGISRTAWLFGIAHGLWDGARMTARDW